MFFDPQCKPEPIIEAPHQQILRKAADLIRTRGLAKHVQQNGFGALCVHGALFKADLGMRFTGYNAKPDHTPAGTLAFDALRTYLGINANWHCANWNNEPKRTAAEVIAALEGAADAS